MKRCAAILFALLFAVSATAVQARGGGHWGRGGASHARSRHAIDNRSYRLTGFGAVRGYRMEPDWAAPAHGRSRRSAAAKAAFKRQNPCPSTGQSTGPCPGYVIDHVIALKRGGLDDPANMQWQTVEAAKAKDRVE